MQPSSSGTGAWVSSTPCSTSPCPRQARLRCMHRQSAVRLFRPHLRAQAVEPPIHKTGGAQSLTAAAAVKSATQTQCCQTRAKAEGSFVRSQLYLNSEGALVIHTLRVPLSSMQSGATRSSASPSRGRSLWLSRRRGSAGSLVSASPPEESPAQWADWARALGEWPGP